MLQEVSTQNGSFDISEDKNPAKRASKSKVERAGAYTIGRNVRTVNSLYSKGTLRTGAFQTSGRNNGDFGTCVDKKVSVTITVMYIKEATRVR